MVSVDVPHFNRITVHKSSLLPEKQRTHSQTEALARAPHRVYRHFPFATSAVAILPKLCRITTGICQLSDLTSRSYSNEPLDSSETPSPPAIHAWVAPPSCQSCPSRLPHRVVHRFRVASPSAPTVHHIQNRLHAWQARLSLVVRPESRAVQP